MADFPDGAALVIGGSGGIGRAICACLAEHGSHVALTYRNNSEAAEEAAATVRAHGRKASVHGLSLDDLDAVKALIASVEETYGSVHSIIHAAGSNIDQPYISQLTPEQWRKVFDADVHGVFHVVHAAIPHLRKSQGSFVFISSAGIRRFPPGDVLSVAPKAAIESLLRGVAREEGRNGIRANSVAVAVVDGGMFPRLIEQGELTQAWIDAAIRNTPLRRFAKPEEIAEAAVFLASNRATFVTGQTLYLDGGYTL